MITDKFLKDFKIKNISSINDIAENGYTILKTDSQYWLNNGINLEDLKNKCDQLLLSEGSNAGKDGKKIDIKNYAEEGANRLTNLIGKELSFKNIITNKDILSIVTSVIGNNIQLSSLDMREPKFNSGQQGLHLDAKQRMNEKEKFFQCTAFLLLDKVEEDNGPLRILPRSHNELVNIKSYSHIQSKRSIEDNNLIEDLDNKKSIKILGDVGNLVFMNVSTFHGGTKNISGKRRRVLFINYRIRNARSQLDHYEFIPKKYHKNFDNLEKYLLKIYRKNFFEFIQRKVFIYRHNFFIKLILAIYVKLLKRK